MPLPKPSPGEDKDSFIGRCMADDVMQGEYPDEDQRYAVCTTQYEAKNKMSTTVLKIYGDIGENVCDGIFCDAPKSISSKEVSEFLDDNKDADEIVVRINSRGGDVQEGWAIHDLLVNSGKKVKTIGEGKIYSIATIIFLSGSEREIMKNADGLIHNPFIPPYTLADQYEAGDLEKIAESLKQEEEKILEFYAARTGAPREKLADYMKDNTKLSAEDMLALGFATKIIEPIQAFAYIKFNTTYKMDEKAFFEKLGSTLDNAILKMKNFSRITPENLTLTDADGKKLNLEKEEGEPAVGDKATPDGEFKMANGQVIVVEGGVITEIKTEMDELSKAQARITELENELAAAKQKETDTVAAEAAFREQESQAKALVAELSELRNQWQPPTRTKTKPVEQKVGRVDLHKVAEITEKLTLKNE